MKNLTRKELRQIINESMNEGFFDSIGQGIKNVFGKKLIINFQFISRSSIDGKKSQFHGGLKFDNVVNKAASYIISNNLPQFSKALKDSTNLVIPAQGVTATTEVGLLNLNLNSSAGAIFANSNPLLMKALNIRKAPAYMDGKRKPDHSRVKDIRGYVNLLPAFQRTSSETDGSTAYEALAGHLQVVFGSDLSRADHQYLKHTLSTVKISLDEDFLELVK